MDDQISSTTPSYGFQHDDDEEEEYRADKHVNSLMDEGADFMQREAEAHNLDEDEILDLAGGAKDALERHRSTLPRTEEPLLDFTEPEPSSTYKPEPEAVKPAPISAFGDAITKPTKSEEKEEKTTVTPSESKSCCSLVDLLYWRDLQRTGVVFGASLFLLLSLSVCSIISVISYVALALLSVTISFRIYKGILQAVQKSEDGHPFKMYLDKDVGISSELVHKYSDTALVRLNSVIKELRRLFLVEDLVDSLKFAVLMWILTYVGALFNGLTILILGLIGAFSWPVIYEKHQAQIDHYYGLVNKQIKDVLGTIQAKIPGAKPKTE
ncbi:reticulon-1-A-like isoform X1 [Labeo rohita]|uniref:Reticulon n=1 Tax=Labeo rohita TaxID=84645 RepID=A0A498N4P6_LABRO|nr:reticulon-4a isoform X1 [Labeo rohita]RXN23865.1 reticulon-1-A-like isoform X1 [Labeo rohita]